MIAPGTNIPDREQDALEPTRAYYVALDGYPSIEEVLGRGNTHIEVADADHVVVLYRLRAARELAV